MSHFSILFRIQMKERFRAMASKNLGENKTRGRAITFGIILLFSLMCLAGMWVALIYGIMYGLQVAGFALELGLFAVFFAAMLMTLIFCIVSILGNLFRSRDVEFLSALPLSGTTIFAAKMAWVYLSELLFTLILRLPALVIYIILTEASVAVLFSGLAVILLLPMLPLAVATLLSLIFVRITSLTRHRDKLMIILGVTVTLAFVVGQQLLSASMQHIDINSEEFIALVSSASAIFERVSKFFPPARFAADAAALSPGALTSWALYLTLSLASAALTLVVASRVYLSSAMRGTETAKKNKNARLNLASLKVGSPVKAFALREFRNITRSVIYAMNSLIGVVMFPLMILIIPFTTMSTLTGGGGFLDTIAYLREVSALAPHAIVFAIAFGSCMFITMTNLVASTSISREGTGVWILKSIPVPYRLQVYGKLLFSVSVSLATIVLAAVLACVLAPPLILPVALGALAACCATVMPTAVGLMVDLARPKLAWHSEAEAIKQNMNGVLGMLISILTSLALALPAVLLSLFVGLWPAVIVTLILSCGLSALSVWLLGSFAEKKLDALIA